MRDYDEPRIAELLSALPPAPEAWVRVAQELPLARLELDRVDVRPDEHAQPRAAPPRRRRARFSH